MVRISYLLRYISYIFINKLSKFNYMLFNFIKQTQKGPGWCGSVYWAWASDQGVAGSVPSQGTCLGCRPGPQWGLREGQPHIDACLPLFLPPFPSL